MCTSCRSCVGPALVLIFCCLIDIREPAELLSDQASRISHAPLSFCRETLPQIKNTLPQMKDLRWQRYMQRGISLQNRDGGSKGEKKTLVIRGPCASAERGWLGTTPCSCLSASLGISITTYPLVTHTCRNLRRVSPPALIYVIQRLMQLSPVSDLMSKCSSEEPGSGRRWRRRFHLHLPQSRLVRGSQSAGRPYLFVACHIEDAIGLQWIRDAKCHLAKSISVQRKYDRVSFLEYTKSRQLCCR